MISTLLSGLVLGGMYVLVAMGLTLQYGVARIMNLSYGEGLIAAAFTAYWLATGSALNPLTGFALVVPVAFVLSLLLYRLLLTPLDGSVIAATRSRFSPYEYRHREPRTPRSERW